MNLNRNPSERQLTEETIDEEMEELEKLYDLAPHLINYIDNDDAQNFPFEEPQEPEPEIESQFQFQPGIQPRFQFQPQPNAYIPINQNLYDSMQYGSAVNLNQMAPQPLPPPPKLARRTSRSLSEAELAQNLPLEFPDFDDYPMPGSPAADVAAQNLPLEIPDFDDYPLPGRSEASTPSSHCSVPSPYTISPSGSPFSPAESMPEEEEYREPEVPEHLMPRAYPNPYQQRAYIWDDSHFQRIHQFRIRKLPPDWRPRQTLAQPWQLESLYVRSSVPGYGLQWYPQFRQWKTITNPSQRFVWDGARGWVQVSRNYVSGTPLPEQNQQ